MTISVVLLSKDFFTVSHAACCEKHRQQAGRVRGEVREHVMHNETDNREHDDCHRRVVAHRSRCCATEPFETDHF